MHYCYGNESVTVTREFANEHKLKTIAFPSISTGIYDYPIQQAAEIALATVRAFIPQPTQFTEVVSCCFSHDDLQIYQLLLARER